MAEIHYIEEAEEHVLSEVICLKCFNRFLELRPVRTFLRNIVCPKCNEKGFIIDTGEIIRDEEYEMVCEQNPNFSIYRKIDAFYQGVPNEE